MVLARFPRHKVYNGLMTNWSEIKAERQQQRTFFYNAYYLCREQLHFIHKHTHTHSDT